MPQPERARGRVQLGPEGLGSVVLVLVQEGGTPGLWVSASGSVLTPSSPAALLLLTLPLPRLKRLAEQSQSKEIC